MKSIKILSVVCASLVAGALSACSSTPEGDSSSASRADGTEAVGVESNELTALQTEEAIADELEARAAAGTLETQWQSAWSESSRLRREPSAANVSALLDARAGAPELLALGSEPLAAYQAAFLPISAQLGKLQASGALDAKLAGLSTLLASASAALPESDESSERAKTFCCHRVADNYGDYCVQYKTIGVWAAVKCYDGQLLDGACAGSHSTWGLPCH